VDSDQGLIPLQHFVAHIAADRLTGRASCYSCVDIRSNRTCRIMRAMKRALTDDMLEAGCALHMSRFGQ
jgi:hypothetical protein